VRQGFGRGTGRRAAGGRPPSTSSRLLAAGVVVSREARELALEALRDDRVDRVVDGDDA